MKKISYLLLVGLLVTNLAYAKTIKTTGQKTITFTTDQGSMSIMFPKGSTFTFPDAWVADATICPTCSPPVTCPDPVVCPDKFKYTHDTFSFTYDKTKSYKMELVSGVVKIYENGVLVKTQNPTTTEKI